LSRPPPQRLKASAPVPSSANVRAPRS
jgi:hypothetical protein